MFVIGNLLSAVATVLDIVLQRAADRDPDQRAAVVGAARSRAIRSCMFLDRVSDLVCNPIRRLFPTVDRRASTSRRSSRCWRSGSCSMFVVRSLHDLAIRM